MCWPETIFSFFKKNSQKSNRSWRVIPPNGLIMIIRSTAMLLLLTVSLATGPRARSEAVRGGRGGRGSVGSSRGGRGARGRGGQPCVTRRVAVTKTCAPSAIALQEGDLLLMGGRSGNIFSPLNGAVFVQLRGRAVVGAPRLPTCRAGCEAAMLGNRVYLVGGFDFDVLASVDALQYTPRYTALSSEVAGGPSSANEVEGLPVSSMLRLTPAAKWMPMPHLKKARTRFGLCTMHGMLWAIGGADAEGDVMSSVEVFNPESNTWMQTAEPMPTARQGLGVAVLGGKIYAIGGTDFEGLPVNVVEVYDPISGTWQGEQPMRMPRERFGIAVLDTCIFVAGGFSEDGRPIADIEVFDLSLPPGNAAS